jgi:hypothetical protein
MSITWRGVRSWGAGLGRGDVLALAGGAVTSTQAQRCGASGWRLRHACTDGHGGAVCPLCGQSVRARPDGVAGRAVRIIEDHEDVTKPGWGR